MKSFALLTLLLFSVLAKAEALSWGDLEIGKKYILNADIPISENLKLNKGDAFSLDDVVGGEVPVLYIIFKNLMCTDNSLTSEMVLFNAEPDDHDHNRSFGVELEENCFVGMFVEGQYYYNVSVFNESDRFHPQSSVH